MTPMLAVEISPPTIDLSSYQPIAGNIPPPVSNENHAPRPAMDGASGSNHTGNAFKTRPQHAKSPYFPARRRSRRLSQHAPKDIIPNEDEESHTNNAIDQDDSKNGRPNGPPPQSQVNGNSNNHIIANGQSDTDITEEDVLLASIEPSARDKLLQFIASHWFLRQGRFPVEKVARKRFTEDLRTEAKAARLNEGAFDGLMKYVRRTYLELYGGGAPGLDALGEGSEFGEEIDDEPRSQPRSQSVERVSKGKPGNKRKSESLEQQQPDEGIEDKSDVVDVEEPNVMTRARKKRLSNAVAEYAFRLSSAGIRNDSLGMGSFQELESVSIPSGTPNRGTPVRESFQEIESVSIPTGTPVLTDQSVVYESDYANYGREEDKDTTGNHQVEAVEPTGPQETQDALNSQAEYRSRGYAENTGDSHIQDTQDMQEDAQVGIPAHNNEADNIESEDTREEGTQAVETPTLYTPAADTQVEDIQAESTQAVDTPTIDTPVEDTQAGGTRAEETPAEGIQANDNQAKNIQDENTQAVDTPDEDTQAEDTQVEATQDGNAQKVDTQAEDTLDENTEAGNPQAGNAQHGIRREDSPVRDTRVEETQEDTQAEETETENTQATHVQSVDMARGKEIPTNMDNSNGSGTGKSLQRESPQPSQDALSEQPMSTIPNGPEPDVQPGESAKPKSRRTERNYRKRRYRRQRIANRKRELAVLQSQQVQTQNPAPIDPRQQPVENGNGLAQDNPVVSSQDF